MLGEGVEAPIDAALSAEAFSVLLEVKDDLGCCEHTFHRVRREPSVRRAIAAQVVQPYVRRHLVPVDYDDPTHRQLVHHELQTIHPSVAEGSFPLPRSGQILVAVDEIYLGCPLSICEHFQFFARTKRRPVCLAERRSAIGTVLKDVPFPIMAHCGWPFPIREVVESVATLLKVEAGTIATVCRGAERYSQDFRLLAVAEA